MGRALERAARGTYEDWSKNVHPDDLAPVQEAFQESLTSDVPFASEYRVVHPDGSVRWIKGDAIVLRNPAGEPVRVVGSNFDLTAIRSAEEELKEAQALAAQAQKLETVGQLTGGVAHDFNNLLAVILGNLELLMSEEEGFSQEESRRYIEDCIEAAQRGADLTNNMLAYARKAQLNPVAVKLNDTVLQTQAWITRTLGARVEIEPCLQADIWPTMVDRGSLQSALVNLLVNARDAVKGSGRIVVETENVVLEDHESSIDGLAPGRYVTLAVTDDGVGMHPADIEKIFDPFYTTKASGEGTGLGLSMVHGFVKQSSGAIHVESEPGRGATFKLFFPALDTEASSGGPLPESLNARESAAADARILLVEDQPQVRTVFYEMLKAAGYRVETAENGDEAFQRLQDDAGFDLIVSDIVMPGELQGPTLARAVRERQPHMPFVFLTGHNNLEGEAEHKIERSDACLIKPVRKEQLLQAVRECILRRA